MASWDDLLNQFAAVADAEKSNWLFGEMTESLKGISASREDRNVLVYASAFLQRPHYPGNFLAVSSEDINGFMGCIYQMDWDKGLTLILHTPGGDPNAADSIVDYLRSKFKDVEVIVPVMAMSAGTMMALAGDNIIMGRQSQLGPIDPQFTMANGSMSARAVVEQFERARTEIMEDNASAHVWHPILSSIGPSLLQDAQNALDYSEMLVGGWLSKWMLSNSPDPQTEARRIAAFFNDASAHKNHGRRINREKVKEIGVRIEDLENDNKLQDLVLTCYHLLTIYFEATLASKLIASSTGRIWMKNHPTQ